MFLLLFFTDNNREVERWNVNENRRVCEKEENPDGWNSIRSSLCILFKYPAGRNNKSEFFSKQKMALHLPLSRFNERAAASGKEKRCI